MYIVHVLNKNHRATISKGKGQGHFHLNKRTLKFIRAFFNGLLGLCIFKDLRKLRPFLKPWLRLQFQLWLCLLSWKCLFSVRRFKQADGSQGFQKGVTPNSVFLLSTDLPVLENITSTLLRVRSIFLNTLMSSTAKTSCVLPFLAADSPRRHYRKRGK